jgi:hypothetical protein
VEAQKPEIMEKQTAQVKDFVEKNIVEANDNGCECPDGRYTKEQSKGRIRLFGADLGILMSIRAALTKKEEDFSTKAIIDRYYNFIKKERGEETKIFYHTDDHSPFPNIGCGHVAKAASGQYDELYGMRANDAQEIWDEIEKFPYSECQTLTGDHKEQGILLISSDKFSINSQDDGKNQMYFVVDVDRSNELLARVAEGIEIDEFTAKDLQNEYWKQVNATSTLLAAGLPQYKVSLNGAGPQVSFAGIVPELS